MGCSLRGWHGWRTGCASSAPGCPALEQGQGRAAVLQPACLSPRESQASALCCTRGGAQPLLAVAPGPTDDASRSRSALLSAAPAHQLCAPCAELVHRQRKEGPGWAAGVEPGEGPRAGCSENKAWQRQPRGSQRVPERGPTASTPKASGAARGAPAAAPAPALAPAAARQLLPNSRSLRGRLQLRPRSESLVPGGGAGAAGGSRQHRQGPQHPVLCPTELGGSSTGCSWFGKGHTSPGPSLWGSGPVRSPLPLWHDTASARFQDGPGCGQCRG